MNPIKRRGIIAFLFLAAVMTCSVVMHIRAGKGLSTFPKIEKQIPVDQANVDAAVIEQLRAAGSDLSKPHELDFFLYFPTEAAAHAASEEIKGDFTVEVRPAAKSKD